MAPKLISLEEHFYSKAVFESLNERGQDIFREHPGFVQKLQDLENDRIKSMDANGIAMQIVSHAWQTDGGDLKACQAGNDELASRIRAYPDRFAAFAALPIGDPRASTEELKRVVRDHGFVGALIDNHNNGAFYDSAEYDCFWECAENLNVPVYIHPALTSQQVMDLEHKGNFSDATARSLSNESWGWHSDTGLHILRLYAAGLFDRFPKLKIIVGHFGEMLPFMLERCSQFSSWWNPRRRSLIDVWNTNVWITTSGVWSLNPIKCILGNTKIDHIMFSVDYPFTPNEQGKQWFSDLEKSGLFTDQELEMIAHGNAERLLKLKTAP